MAAPRRAPSGIDANLPRPEGARVRNGVVRIPLDNPDPRSKTRAMVSRAAQRLSVTSAAYVAGVPVHVAGMYLRIGHIAP